MKVIYLNYRNPPKNAIACTIRGVAIDSLLNMIGATPGFIRSLSLSHKKAIIFLASYAVDWRACDKEYHDLVFCFSRAARSEKSALTGLPAKVEPLKYAEHIRVTRIEPKIVRLREMSYRLNSGITANSPVSLSDDPSSSKALVEDNTSESASPVSVSTPITRAQPEDDLPSVIMLSPISETADKETTKLSEDSKATPDALTGEPSAGSDGKHKKDEDDISIDDYKIYNTEPASAQKGDDTTREEKETYEEDDMAYPSSKKRKFE
ncbi:hypothetical protein RRF57_000875 [Xylaria bambusicola]|uniref:Uncharacterized protein n=1 Tax=Xylaria bambusicola TaxID=326684 RepID=A0AAN7UPG5_9PEZI